jgi:DNA helicase IV
MLSAILDANPNIRLMAVGDDWQAINGFAGAELRFFYDFAKYFPGAGEVTVATNYRSDASVIDSGNRLMQGLGPAARLREDAGAGEIRQIEVSNVWLEFRSGQQYEENRMRDSIFLPDIPDGKAPTIPQQKVAKVLKTAAVLYKKSSFKSLLLVSRTKRAYGLELDDFRARLIDVIVYLYGEDTEAVRKKIRLMTAHTSKGQEADSVLVLDASERNFPKIHPDNLLYEIFGVTPAEVLSEEKRLFYVAISRAFHRLWIMTDKKEKSQYLQDIGRDENDLAFKHPLKTSTSEKAHRSLVYKRIVKMLAQ